MARIGERQEGFDMQLSDLGFFGSAVASIGDIDSNGYTDMIIGEYLGNSGRGSATIVRMGPNYTAVGTTAATESGPKGPIELALFDLFGISIASIGDLTGDGVQEVAVGAAGHDDLAALNSGAVYVLSLGQQGEILDWVLLSGASDVLRGRLAPGDLLGASVGWLGDLDGDCHVQAGGLVSGSESQCDLGPGGGTVEIGAGAVLADDGGLDQGAVWVISLNGTMHAVRAIKLSATTGGFVGPLRLEDSWGSSVARVRSLDRVGGGEGVLRAVGVGCTHCDDGAADAGAIFVLWLDSNCSVQAEQRISRTEGGLVGGYVGSAVGLNGTFFGSTIVDLVPDRRARAVTLGLPAADIPAVIAVGSTTGGRGGYFPGQVWLLQLADNGSVLPGRELELSSGRNGILRRMETQDGFGVDAAVLAPAPAAAPNGLDGLVLVVGAEGDDGLGADRGAAWVVELGNASALELRAPPPATAAEGNATILAGITLEGSLDSVQQSAGSVNSPAFEEAFALALAALVTAPRTTDVDALLVNTVADATKSVPLTPDAATSLRRLLTNGSSLVAVQAAEREGFSVVVLEIPSLAVRRAGKQRNSQGNTPEWASPHAAVEMAGAFLYQASFGGSVRQGELTFSAADGVALMERCPCDSGQFVSLDSTDTACDTPTADTLPYVAATVSVVGVAVVGGAILFLLGVAEARGAVVVLSMGLHLADVLSDVSLLQVLAVEYSCEAPLLAQVSLASLVAAAVGNLVCACLLLLEVRARRADTAEFFSQHAAALSVLALLCTSGVSGIELLSSQVGGLGVFSLFEGSPGDIAWFRRRVRYYGMPQVVLEDCVQLGLQFIVVTGAAYPNDRGRVSLAVGLALAMSVASIFRLLLQVLFTYLGEEGATRGCCGGQGPLQVSPGYPGGSANSVGGFQRHSTGKIELDQPDHIIAKVDKQLETSDSGGGGSSTGSPDGRQAWRVGSAPTVLPLTSSGVGFEVGQLPRPKGGSNEGRGQQSGGSGVTEDSAGVTTGAGGGGLRGTTAGLGAASGSTTPGPATPV